MEKINLSWDDVRQRAHRVCEKIVKTHASDRIISIYGVPRGGIYPAMLVAEMLERHTVLVEDSQDAMVIIDDIIDSGDTLIEYQDKAPHADFYALVNKLDEDQAWENAWVSFPWERMTKEDDPRENVKRLLQYVGEDPEREGLKDTPERVIRSYDTLFGGYRQDPRDVMKVFEDGACDEMVLLKDCEFNSTCEHHMLPFIGKAHIAYIPNGKVIGVSKLARILEIYARRLQIQERIGQQVTQCLMDHLQPKGAACILEAKHTCMTSRGVQKQDSVMVTSSLRGVFLEDARTRAEFMSMIR